MKTFFIVAALLTASLHLPAQTGSFSLGTRNTISVFNEDKAIGKGIGGQFRIQFSQRLNSEWYFDYITSNKDRSYRNDYHIGWSVMLYPGNNFDFKRLLQPYLIAGHCFDYSKVAEINNKVNAAHRLSMATQAGFGTHININQRLDCSVTSQYMLHFGKDIETGVEGDQLVIEKQDHSHADGHLLFSVSVNYKFFKLWNKE